MRNGQFDIAITTTKHIAQMLEQDDAQQHAAAIRIIRTFVSALELTAPPKRTRKPRTRTAPAP